MYEIVYCSFAGHGLGDEEIEKILSSAQEFNLKNNITGCLLYFNHQFIQIIEGEKEVVEDLYAHISGDQRHSSVLLISKGEKKERAFTDWRMAFHKLSHDEMEAIGKEMFVENFISFSEMANKPTASVIVFWILAKQLLQGNAE